MKLSKRQVLYAILLLAIPITLWSLPSTFFDEGTSISIFALLGVEEYAYSTGMTRAVMHLMHLDFEGASKFNKLSFIVLPILIIVWIKLLLQQFNVYILKWL